VTARLQLRQKLGCKSFKWFLDTIYPDLSVPEDRPGMFGMVSNGTPVDTLDPVDMMDPFRSTTHHCAPKYSH
jgi:hypothetical protein